ncbi:laminin beta 1 chain, putative [Ixodes scapularis]|uniref:Laminin beta 1 chain, putative n=1 Tax=Ixodes scapularis TaxID=6945 RepID=B7QHE0_IXOSC|nr:laminin beta 1 chain, putative [Ixodes scapularis]|eukprot:XP_002414597.1 laminin beta 1 chain, putative [Ixodes scapularis]
MEDSVDWRTARGRHRAEDSRGGASRHSSEVDIQETREDRWPGPDGQRSSYSSRRYHQTPRESEEEESDDTRTNYTRRRYSVSAAGSRGHLSGTERGSRQRSEADLSTASRGSLDHYADRDQWSGRSSSTTEKPEEDKTGATYVRQRYYSISSRKIEGVAESAADLSKQVGHETSLEHRREGGGGRQTEVGSSERVWTSGRRTGSGEDYGSSRWRQQHGSTADGRGGSDATTEGPYRSREWDWRSRTRRPSTFDQDTRTGGDMSRTHVESSEVGGAHRTYQRYREGTSIRERHRVTSTGWRNASSDLSGEPTAWEEDARRRYGTQEGIKGGHGSSEDGGRSSYSRTSYTRRTNGTSYRGGTYYSRWAAGGRENVTTTGGSSLSYGASRTSGTYGGSEDSLSGYTRRGTTQAPTVIDRVDVVVEERHPLSGSSRGSQPQACEESSCYPATGNLLIGREDKLSATSTCGLRAPEAFCIVSHLKERTKCFRCDSRSEGRNYHGIENIVFLEDVPHSFLFVRIGGKRHKGSWWQSENGVQGVSIRLDLEAEFHFTHLIITFKTFRPAAMLIERSHDNGNSWRVYQYFAYDCADSFPGVPTGPRRNITDVTCETQYSGVEPSSGGEVIFRVLPPHIPIDNPHSPDVQNLLKMTNLRINFTRLHTLGDNLLDSRQEIKQKYYYAVYDMVVRGSCSCYGHASRCIPEEDDHRGGRDDMVYGKCQCTHNTKGLNCESCEELYNDQPWRPASEHDPNPCKQCNCNGHASRCHFDAAVWERSGRVSGGVCDDCRDNTMGLNCEQCVPFYYKDPQRDPSDPYACQPCDCDPRGSLDEGVCDPQDDIQAGSVAGRCHCKKNVESRRCDRCKRGHFNFQAANPDGCEPCSCHELGTAGDGCNVYTGECTCKRNVIGRDCNQCLPEYWGLGNDEDGCKPCDCDPGGAYENSCDVVTGQCRCRPSVQGRRCDQPDTGFFVGNMDYMVYEAELAKASPDCQVLVREPYAEREATWTGLGFMQVHEDSYLEFDVTDVPTSMEYDIVFRYEPKLAHGWDEAIVTIDRQGPVDPSGPCANVISQDNRQVISFPASDRYVVVAPPVCLEKGRRYKVRITFKQYDRIVDTPSASILIDSMVLLPHINAIPFFHGTPANEYRRDEFERFRCGQAFYTVRRGSSSVPDICKKYLYSIGFYVYGGAHDCRCDAQGSHSSVCNTLGGQCQCKANVVGRNCDRCAPGTYGFGPGGCRPCDCNGIGSLDNFCDAQTGQCKCRPNTYGRQCDECQPGYWNYPNCQRCECHGHADTCDSRTGHCSHCRDFTSGPHCDRCETGFYGDPRYGVDIPCRPCPCPGTIDSGVNHATSCDLDPRTGNVACHCSPGYVGERCDRCANNYYGEPNAPGGECRRCECSGNTDDTQPGNCDSRTGVCLRCLYNTEGHHCERCKPGHYGDASRQQCLECVCNMLGMDHTRGYCDAVTGQCPCLPNVEGRSCDRCAPNFWKIASGEGCEDCGCDPQGSYDLKCNEFDGQCPCKPGHGGRQCNQCQDLHWGNPRVRCYQCECNVPGAATSQCHRNNGSCVCIPGVAGDRCQECARGFTGRAPYCDSCGECFDNWDRIIQELKVHKSLDPDQTAQNTLESRRNLTESQLKLDEVDQQAQNVTQRTFAANLALSDIHERAQKLGQDAKALRDNTTALQEANVEGALNITREAQKRSQLAVARARGAQDDVMKSEMTRRVTERMLESAASRYNDTYQENEAALRKLQEQVADLEDQISDVNELVCYKRGTVERCDPVCGGAGCNSCGGLGCEDGSVTRANNTLAMAQETNELLAKKESDARTLFAAVGKAQKESQRALDEAKKAFERAQTAKNQSEDVSSDLQDLLDRIDKFLNEAGARPAEIRVLAEECTGLSISLEPEQIRELAREINQTIASLTDIDAILRETGPDLALAKELKARADLARDKANKILDTAKKVLQNLNDAEQAQDRAKQAIEKARDNIEAAEKDLDQEAEELEEQYKRAMADLSGKSAASGDMKDRAEKLRERARKLAEGVNSKTTMLQGMEDEFDDNERRLKDYSQILEQLNREMTGYLDLIERRSTHYRECQN